MGLEAPGADTCCDGRRCVRTAQKGPLTVHPQSAGELDDGALSEEIRLLGALVLAASGTTRHLTPDEVDEVLDLAMAGGEPPHAADSG
jgi:hypothetical protein